MKAEWEIEVGQIDLVNALTLVRDRKRVRRVRSNKPEPWVTLASSDLGFSVRGSVDSGDMEGVGSWHSPIRVHGDTLAKLTKKVPKGTVRLLYINGFLYVNTTRLTASEI
jgi:hypothetical protein